jgi:hypothetical protein
MKNLYKTLIEKLDRMRPIGGHMHRCEENIKIFARKKSFGGFGLDLSG